MCVYMCSCVYSAIEWQIDCMFLWINWMITHRWEALTRNKWVGSNLLLDGVNGSSPWLCRFQFTIRNHYVKTKRTCVHLWSLICVWLGLNEKTLHAICSLALTHVLWFWLFCFSAERKRKETSTVPPKVWKFHNISFLSLEEKELALKLSIVDIIFPLSHPSCDLAYRSRAYLHAHI